MVGMVGGGGGGSGSGMTCMHVGREGGGGKERKKKC